MSAFDRYQDAHAEIGEALVAALFAEGMLGWYCEAWEQRQGVSEPCEAGSTHDAPDFDCHWRLVADLPAEEEE